MKLFVEKHADKITGTISCFDRLLFKGYLPLRWPEAMEGFIAGNGLRIKDFKHFVRDKAEKLKEHAKALAEKSRQPYMHLSHRVSSKEDLAKAIAARDKVTEGLVCVMTAVEACQSFKIAYGKNRPKIQNARRKCLCIYFYFIDRELGFLHVRIQTWFPFTVQVCLNGHNWLARKLDRHGICYKQLDNAFLSIEDHKRAQRFADRFVNMKWPRILTRLARRVNPLMRNVLKKMDYYWVTDQAEHATDILFRNRISLKDLYEKLVKHATHCFSAEDVMTFLGKKLNGNFAGEIINDYKKRWPGVRVKHRMKENWIKMYDKFGCVLRIETVINNPYGFKILRNGIRKGQQYFGWYPMAKGVSNLYRYAEVSRSANMRYLNALAQVDDPTEARRELQRLARTIRRNDRPYRGFNPASEDDVTLFDAVLRGEHFIQGFRNHDIRGRLFKSTENVRESRRQSAYVSRLLKRLHVHGLIAKIPRSRRWRATERGQKLISTVLIFHHEKYMATFISKAS
jgi:hypothetical protein